MRTLAPITPNVKREVPDDETPRSLDPGVNLNNKPYKMEPLEHFKSPPAGIGIDERIHIAKIKREEIEMKMGVMIDHTLRPDEIKKEPKFVPGKITNKRRYATGKENVSEEIINSGKEQRIADPQDAFVMPPPPPWTIDIFGKPDTATCEEGQTMIRSITGLGPMDAYFSGATNATLLRDMPGVDKEEVALSPIPETKEATEEDNDDWIDEMLKEGVKPDAMEIEVIDEDGWTDLQI